MDDTKQLEQLSRMVLEMDIAGVGVAVEECLASSIPASRILAEGLSAGMRTIGEKFKCGEVYMPEVVVACDVYYRGLEILRPHIQGVEGQIKGKMILGTIHGDIHTVGKDVAIPVFQAAGYDVVDLGVDVPDARFVDAIREHRPDLVGFGTYMISTFMHTSETVRAIREAGLRAQVKIICGGPAVDSDAAKRMGADDACDDAWEAVGKLDRLLAELEAERRKS